MSSIIWILTTICVIFPHGPFTVCASTGTSVISEVQSSMTTTETSSSIDAKVTDSSTTETNSGSSITSSTDITRQSSYSSESTVTVTSSNENSSDLYSSSTYDVTNTSESGEVTTGNSTGVSTLYYTSDSTTPSPNTALSTEHSTSETTDVTKINTSGTYSMEKSSDTTIVSTTDNGISNSGSTGSDSSVTSTLTTESNTTANTTAATTSSTTHNDSMSTSFTSSDVITTFPKSSNTESSTPDSSGIICNNGTTVSTTELNTTSFTPSNITSAPSTEPGTSLSTHSNTIESVVTSTETGYTQTNTETDTNQNNTTATSDGSDTSLSTTVISTTPFVSSTTGNTLSLPSTPPTTEYPTQMPIIPVSFTIHFTFALHLNGTFKDDLMNNTEFKRNVTSEVKLYIFDGYEAVIDIAVSDVSKGSIIVRLNNTLKIGILGDNPYGDLQRFKEKVKQNAISNITEINTGDYGRAENNSCNITDKIQEELNDNKIAEIICQTGRCSESQKCTNSGTCIHKCDLAKDHCGENGICYYDLKVHDLHCRCESKTLTVYYGPRCEQETGRLEYILGLSLGTGAAIVIIIIVGFCCCLRKTRKENSYSRSAKHLLKDCDNDMKMSDLNYRWSDREYRDVPHRYERDSGHTNQAYEPLGNVKRSVVPSEIYLPDEETKMSTFESSIGQAPSLLNIDSSRDYSIKRPNIYHEPTEDYDSPYRVRQSFLHQKQEKYQIEGPKRYGMDEIRTTF